MDSISNNLQTKYLHGDKFIKFWEDFYDNHEFQEGEKINLYFDFPYCASTCKYCMIQPSNLANCKNEIPIYEEELVKLTQKFSHLFGRHQIGQIAFGGGTASMLSRNALKGIIDAVGPSWDNALVRKMEVHPHDLNDEYVDWLISDFHITNMSIGIQSFDPISNRDQHRITCDIGDLLKYVRKLHTNNVSVNIDLVALFNGETERDWEIFRNDIKIVREIFNPDMFFTQVNYATGNRYYEYTLRMRKELINFIKNAPEYVFSDDRFYKLDIDDVMRYLDTTYFMIKPDYYNYLKENGLYKDDPRFGNYIGFGGNLSHKAFCLTSDRQTIYTCYDFDKKRWLHELMPTEVPKASNNGFIPTINVGKYVIPPYDPKISGPIEELYAKLEKI